MKRKIAIFTGNRSEYGLLRPIILQVLASKKLDLQLIVGATHLLKSYGETIKNIEGDGIPITSKVDFAFEDEMPGKISFEVGKGITELTKTFLDLDPDIVIVNGDRSESFAAASSAALLPKVVGHISGGEVSEAGIDESMRHAITKLAHLHFVSTSGNKRRVINMGEKPENVFLVGAPGLDDFVSLKNLAPEELGKTLGIPTSDIIVVLQHPVTTSPESAGWEMSQTLEAVTSLPGVKVVIYPNGDPGSEKMINEINKYKESKDFYVFQNIERSIYVNLLKHANILVGNSSGGIVESASVGLPTVNIGIRQAGRDRNANVIMVGYNSDDIKRAIEKGLSLDFRKSFEGKPNIYGYGKSSDKIVKILEEIDISNLIQKHFYESSN